MTKHLTYTMMLGNEKECDSLRVTVGLNVHKVLSVMLRYDNFLISVYYTTT